MGTDDIFGREKKNRNKYERKKRGTLTRARLGTINNNAMCIVHFTFNPFFSFSWAKIVLHEYTLYII